MPKEVLLFVRIQVTSYISIGLYDTLNQLYEQSNCTLK